MDSTKTDDIKRVHIKFLEFDVKALRNKLKLHQDVQQKAAELLETIHEPIVDPEHQQLLAASAQRHEIVLQLDASIQENEDTKKELLDSFEKFKIDLHRKSIAECSEIIFEMRRLRGQLNIYLNFKNNAEMFRKNCEELENAIAKKTADFLNNTKASKMHVNNQKLLVKEALYKKLTDEAFRIGWKNINSSDSFLRVRQDNRALKAHIESISILRKRRTVIKKPCNIKPTNFDQQLVVKVNDLREEISHLTTKINKLRAENKEKAETKIRTSSITPMLDLYSEYHREELREERKFLDETRTRLCKMYSNYSEMATAKEQIFKLASMVANFNPKSYKRKKDATECHQRFEQYELENFLTNILKLLDRPFIDRPEKIVSQPQLVVPSMNIVNVMPERIDLLIPIPVSSSLVSSELMEQNLAVIDVENDTEELVYTYESENGDEEPVEDNLSEEGDLMGDSDSSF